MENLSLRVELRMTPFSRMIIRLKAMPWIVYKYHTYDVLKSALTII